MSDEVCDLLIVGAGAKAAAIAAKVDAMNGLGLAELTVTIVEKTEPAASWKGLNGMTSGEEPLAVPPIKDVGFPYRSSRQFPAVGDELDAALLPLSWQRHAIERGEYAPWVNSGAPPILHRDYGTYLDWVLERATEGVTMLSGRVVAVELDAAREHWVIDVEGDEPRRLRGRALLLTGPGVHRAFPHDPAAEPRVLHCDSRRGEFARLPGDREVDVAIVGGGESALSALVFLRAMRPQAKITVYTPMLPLSRGESFLENRVFADPDDVGWEHLDLETRKDFVKHCDRGVFDAGVIARLAGEQRCSFELGRAVQVNAARGGEEVELELETAAGPAIAHHEYVVNCTGFDLLAQLRGLFAEPVRADLEARVGPIWDRPPGAELRFDRSLALDGMEPRLHIPGLAGLSQGPGFANLGSLGLLANRVLAPLVPALTKAKRGAAAAVLTILVIALLAGCGGGGSTSGESKEASANLKFGETALPNVDPGSTRQTGGPIDRESVEGLKVAWAIPETANSTYGSYASTPVVSGGVVYSQDLQSNVAAIEQSTGKVLWVKQYESPSHGPNGLAVDEGLVFGATAEEAFALDAETGKQVWAVKLTRGPKESIDMAPGVNDGQVYVSTVPVTATEDYGAGAVGVLWALDTKTGKKLWHFNTVPDGLWSKEGKEVNSGGGLWYPPSFDRKGDVYIGTGNPGPLPGTPDKPWGASRPGRNLYSDSLVKLDPKTGKVIWYYQQTPHNIYDWDFQDSPVIVSVGGRELAIGAGKSGVVVALDAKTGKVVWKTPVGKHNGHDDDSLLAMRGEGDKIKLGEVFPGELGGVLTPMATDGKMVFAPVVNHSMVVKSGSEVAEESAATGELVAVDLATGKIAWNAEFEGPAYGAATVVNDLVFVTSAEGIVHAFDTSTGGEVWNVSLPAGTNAGVTISGDMLLAGAGLPVAEGQKPALVAYRLGG